MLLKGENKDNCTLLIKRAQNARHENTYAIHIKIHIKYKYAHFHAETRFL